MDFHALFVFLVPIVVGSIIGGVTNTIAIIMLFRPEQPIRLFGRFTLPFTPGLIPKRKRELATSIAQTVRDLLPPEALASALDSPDVKKAVAERVNAILRQYISLPLSESLSKVTNQSWPALVDSTCARLESWITTLAVKDECKQAVEKLVGEWLESLKTSRIDALVGAESLTSLEQFIGRTIRQTMSSDRSREHLLHFIEEKLENALDADVPIKDLVGEKVISSVETYIIEGITDRLPDILAELLDSSETQEYLRAKLEEVLSKQKLLARWFGPSAEKLVAQINEGLRDELEKLPGKLRSKEARGYLLRVVRRAFTSVVSRPLSATIRKLSSADYIHIKNKTKEFVATMLLSDETASKVTKLMIAVVQSKYGSQVEQLLSILTPEEQAKLHAQLAENICKVLADKNSVQQFISELRPQVERRLAALRPSEIISADGFERLSSRLANNILKLMEERGNVSEVVQHIDIRPFVEAKITAFSTEELEKVVRGVATRELRGIEALGYVLGAIVGAAQSVCNLFL